MKQKLVTAEPPATSTQQVVELRDVVMHFGGKQVLDHVSLAVAPQERLVIIGQSGASKTTILRLILGILKPDSGSVFFKQHQVSQMNDHATRASPDADGDGVSRFSTAEFAHCPRKSGTPLAGADQTKRPLRSTSLSMKNWKWSI